MKMRYVLIAGLALAGCKKEPAKAAEGMGSGMSGSSAMAAGSGSGSASGSAATTKPTPVTPEVLGKTLAACWQDWEGAKWDAFQDCYASDASVEMPGSAMAAVAGAPAIVEHMKAQRGAFPDEKGALQMMLVSGHRVVSVALISGKNSGAMKTPQGDQPATNNMMGVLMGQVLTVDDAGKITHEANYLDGATIAHQLKPDKDHPVRAVMAKLTMPAGTVIAKDDGVEHANLATIKQLVDGFNKHDDKAVAARLADDAVWSEQALPKDQSKKEAVGALGQLWKGFSDLKLASADSVAAGDYVVTTASFQGTNDGDLPGMHVKKTGKKLDLPMLAVYELSGGKIKAAWMFYQSAGLAAQLGLTAPKK